MSWIFGTWDIELNESFKIESKIREKILFEKTKANLYVTVGGIPETAFYSFKDDNSGWIVCGIGIKTGEFEKIFQQEEWNNAIENNNVSLDKLEGHYVIIKWKNNKIEFFTDRLGLRDIYIAKYDNGFIFSTRLDYINQITKEKINFKIFGARWQLFNQLSHNCFVENISRICCGSKATIQNNNLTIYDNKWFEELNVLPTNSFNEFDFFNELKRKVLLPKNSGLTTSLSLSGGMDSRVMLSFLLGEKTKWDTHTFGDVNNPDSVIARRMANHFNFQNIHLDLSNRSVEQYIKLLDELVSYTFVNNPASYVLQFQYYSELYKKTNVIIDGGFGEIWRREFFNRLLIKGKLALYNKDLLKIINYISSYRADIFNDDVNAIIQSGIVEQLEQLFILLPDLSVVGAEDWLDLLAIKTRIVNFYSHEQVRLDGIVNSFMPFIQLTLLSNFRSIPSNKRKNSKIFRNIILKNNRELSRFPLAKGQITYPYSFNSLGSRLYMIGLKKIGKYPLNNTQTNFLNFMKEYIIDIFESRNVKECGLYNMRKIQNIVNGFYSNRKEYTNQLDWLLTFERLRNRLSQ